MNNLHRQIILGIVSIGVCSASWAATVIKRNEMGFTQKVTIDGQNVRIDSPNPRQYVLMDLGNEKVYMVNAEERRFVQMDIIAKPPQRPWERPPQDRHQRPWERPQQDRSQRSIKAELVKKGNGPNIGGYSTLKYEVKALGKVCFETYFSKEAAKVTNVKAFMEAQHKMSISRQPMPPHPCQMAYNKLEAEIMKLGFPMKGGTKFLKKNVNFEVVAIKKNVDVSVDVYTNISSLKGEGYREISEWEMMEEMRKKMEKQPRNYGQHRY